MPESGAAARAEPSQLHRDSLLEDRLLHRS